MKLDFKGFIGAAFTALSADGKELILKDVPAYASYLAKNGCNGVLVNGTTGEGPSLTQVERKLAAEAWLAGTAGTGLHVMVGVGGTNLKDVQELAQHAEEKGANSLLCLPDLYNKAENMNELVDYLSIVAAAAPKTPLLYYHTPLRTGIAVDLPVFLSLAGKRIKTFAGVKVAEKNMDMALAALNVEGGAYTVFIAHESILAGAAALGFDCFNLTCLSVFPRQIVQIIDLVKENKVEEARAAQNSLNAAVAAIVQHGKPVPTLKAAMNLLSGFNLGPARAPLRNPSDQQIQTMQNALKALKLL